MENQGFVRNITFKDLWDLLIRRLWVMILAAAVVAGGLYAGANWLTAPEYESTATLYILRQNGEDSSTDVSTDFSLALKVVNDCTYLLKSRSVLNAVIEELALPMDYETLYDCISTANPDDTRILEVTVTTASPEQAKEIVDALCRIGTVRIRDAMGFEQVNLYEYGTLNTESVGGLGLMACVLAGVITAVLVYSVFLVVFLLDDRIRKEEDLEKILGLSILGNIPSADVSNGKAIYGAKPYRGKSRKE